MIKGKEEAVLPDETKNVIEQFVTDVKSCLGSSINSMIVFGSYARGDFNAESDIDIMILLDLTDMEIKNYRHQLSGLTYDFNMEHEIDIKPIAKNQEHFQKWLGIYPFYSNINSEGVELFGAA